LTPAIIIVLVVVVIVVIIVVILKVVATVVIGVIVTMISSKGPFEKSCRDGSGEYDLLQVQHYVKSEDKDQGRLSSDWKSLYKENRGQRGNSRWNTRRLALKAS
jgi:hypothetical protein